MKKFYFCHCPSFEFQQTQVDVSKVTAASLQLWSTLEASVASAIRAKRVWLMDVGSHHFPRLVSFASPISSSSLLVWATLLCSQKCSAAPESVERGKSAPCVCRCGVELGWKESGRVEQLCGCSFTPGREHHLPRAGGRGELWGNLGSWENLYLLEKNPRALAKEKRSWSDTYFIQVCLYRGDRKNKVTFDPKNPSLAQSKWVQNLLS